MNIPTNFSLQYSRLNGDITHQGIVASNINNSPLQLTFPATTTGTSLGHYTHYGVTGNCSEHLNMSGTLEGGHNFWHSNSTGIPKLTLSIKRDYLLLDTMLKNTSGKINLDMVGNKLLFTDFNQKVSLAPDSITLRNTATSDVSRIQPTNIAFGNDVTGHLTTINTDFYTITDTSNTFLLTSTKLTFNGVPQVKNITLQYSSPAIDTNGASMTNAPSSITDIYPYFGWYFKNNASNFINWTFPSDNLSVQNFSGFYLNFFNHVGLNNPKVTIYTSPTGTNDFAPSYHSSRTFILPAITTNKLYTAFMNLSGNCPSIQYYNSSLLNMTISSTSGDYQPSQQVLSINIQTDVGASGSIEIIVTKFGVITTKGTQEWILMP